MDFADSVGGRCVKKHDRYEECDVAVIFGSWKKTPTKEWKNDFVRHHHVKQTVIASHKDKPLIVNNNQIKAVQIENGGTGYSNGTASIVGDGSGATVSIAVDSSGTITSVTVTNGGKGYTYGIIDLKTNSGSGSKLIPIIPPSKGHGYNIYEELGTDRVLMYARFDDSTKDFPIDTKFAQVGIIKNPETFSI